MDCVDEVETLQFGLDFNFSSAGFLDETDETVAGDCVCEVVALFVKLLGE